MLGAEIAVGIDAATALTAWRLFALAASELSTDSLRGKWRMRSRELDALQVEKALVRMDTGEFEVEHGQARVTFVPLPRFAIALARVEELDSEALARSWIRPFLELNGLIGARIFDAEYEFWQNAEDLLSYRTRGRPFDNLPLKSNGLPPPLERTVVDISMNPGRRVLRRGGVESIGSEMWLGTDFWQFAGSEKSAVKGHDWLHSEDLSNGVTYLRAAETAFSTALGEVGIRQQRLRALLYPRSLSQ